MKTRTMIRFTLLSFALFTALASLPASAQPENPASNTPATVPAPPPGYATTPAPYGLEIEGGRLVVPPQRGRNPQMDSIPTLENIVRLLREQHPEANIAMAPELADLRIIDVKVRGNNLAEKLTALRVASGERFVFNDTQYAGDSKDHILFTLTPSDRLTRETSISQVEAFNFSAYFDGLKNAQNLDEKGLAAAREKTLNLTEEMIQRTIDSLGSAVSRTVQIQFHPGANLMVVTGSPDAVNVARKVVSAMIGQPPSSAPPAQDALQGIRAIESKRIDLQVENQELKAKIAGILARADVLNNRLNAAQAQLEAAQKALEAQKPPPEAPKP